ncbi:MAG: hypothetical protein PHU21_13770, partial [Elusimicrobia bacterium]|nr:hypothetical protein [Elusimicrobiota bacterium]
MKSIRRRRSDLEEPRAFLRSWPHTALYPALGFVVGLFTPLGIFLMRYLLARPVLATQWMRYELEYNANFYAIMAIGTTLSFMLFGYILGRHSEEQRGDNRVLRARIDELHLKSVTDGLTG